LEPKPRVEIGLYLDNVPAQIAQSANIPGGAYLTLVKPGSLADDAGLEGADQGQGQGQGQGGIGDVIVAANGTPIKDAQDFVKFVKSLKSGDPLVLKFLRPDMQGPQQIKFTTCYTSIVIP
jgi:S1-C subfamily serine protease